MLVSFWMIQRLTREICSLEKDLIDRQTELSNYQRYSSMLGSSSVITAGNLAGLPTSLLSRASLFAQYANQASNMSAMQNLQQMKMMGQIPMFQNPLMQQQYEMSAANQFREQAMKALKQQEANILNEKEKAIQLEVNDIQNQIDIKRKRLENARKSHSDSINSFYSS